jgi:hypothetical protein
MRPGPDQSRVHPLGLRFQAFHRTHFLGTSTTASMSLCRMDCSPRLSHSRVTLDRSVSVTVPWSLLSFRQQTRAPAFSNLDWPPVIRLVDSLRFCWCDQQ